MKIASLDPSFSCTGIALFDSGKKEFTLTCLKGDGQKHKKFIDIQQSIHSYTIHNLENILEGIDSLITEEPFPFGMFSSGLFALDTAICQHFFTVLKQTYNPRTLEFIHSCKAHKKSQSVSLCNNLISILSDSGYSFIRKSKGNDAAEAFIYLIHYMLENNLFEIQLKNKINSLNNKLGLSPDEIKQMKKKRDLSR